MIDWIILQTFAQLPFLSPFTHQLWLCQHSRLNQCANYSDIPDQWLSTLTSPLGPLPSRLTNPEGSFVSVTCIFRQSPRTSRWCHSRLSGYSTWHLLHSIVWRKWGIHLVNTIQYVTNNNIMTTVCIRHGCRTCCFQAACLSLYQTLQSSHQIE